MSKSLVEPDVQSPYFCPFPVDISIFSLVSLFPTAVHLTLYISLNFTKNYCLLSVDMEVDYAHFNTIKLKARIILTTLFAEISSKQDQNKSILLL